MKWSNLNWDEGLYFIRETQSRNHGFTTAKTESSEAEVPVPRVLLDALSDHRKRQAEAKLLKGKGWQEMDLIFPSSKGTPLQHTQLSGHWHPAVCKAAGLRHVSLHTLRKTGASILEGMGVTRPETMAALRHKRGSVTDRYVGIDMEQRRQHIEELASLLASDAQALEREGGGREKIREAHDDLSARSDHFQGLCGSHKIWGLPWPGRSASFGLKWGIYTIDRAVYRYFASVAEILGA
jgi:hypothetical protein